MIETEITTDRSPCPFSCQVLKPLADVANPKRVVLPGNLLAEKCGRNNIWRLTAVNAGVYFARLSRSKGEHERALYGLQLAEGLAATHGQFMAASVVCHDDVDWVFVTRQLPGVALSELFKSAYRLDRNPLRRSGPQERCRAAISLLIQWLNEFHKLDPHKGIPLHDYSLHGIRRRINRKLNSSVNGKTYARHLGVQLLDEIEGLKEHDTLIFGDVTLGNFFFDGSRLGAIDFEDIGIGPGIRDQVCLRREFLRAFEKIHYLTDRTLLSLTRQDEGQHISLIELEMALMRFAQLLTSCKSADRRAASAVQTHIVELSDQCRTR